MERLTPERGERTWKLFHLSWYVNIVAVAIVMGAALFMFRRVLDGSSPSVDADVTIMMAFMVIGGVLLMGAGISRYQARLEGQHLEIKMAVNKLIERLDEMKK